MGQRYTDVYIERVRKQISGGSDGLWVPVTPQVAGPTGTVFIVFSTYFDLSGDRRGGNRLWELLRGIDAEQAIVILSGINLVLSLGPADGALHSMLQNEFLRPDLAVRLPGLDDESIRGAKAVVFNRPSILASMRAASMAWGTAKPRRPPDTLTRRIAKRSTTNWRKGKRPRSEMPGHCSLSIRLEFRNAMTHRPPSICSWRS